MKNFFSITSNHYEFEIFDLTALITVINIVLIVLGYWWAPFFGLVNCIICLTFNVKTKAHINSYVTQTMLIILNTYFLTL